MHEHKRKRLAEEWCTDIKPTHIKKQLNSSERWRAKRHIEKEVNDIPDIQTLRWNMEIRQSDACREEEMLGPAARLSETLYNIGLGHHELYKCTCENFDLLSDEEILKRNGY